MCFHKTRILGALLALLALQGCASIISDSKYPVTVTSSPAGANFEVINKSGVVVHRGSTPGVVTLMSGEGYFRGQTYTLRFMREGYPDRQVELDSSVDGWYWANILFGGVIGMLIVDPLTGAMYKLPDEVSADLGQPVAEAMQGTLRIVSINDLDPAQRAQLVALQ